jgi:hypothetical protein
MRNINGTTMAQSSTSTTHHNHHHSQLLAQHAQATIVEGYDFGRARSSESTENTLTGKAPKVIVSPTRTMSSPPRGAASSSFSTSFSFAAEEEEEGRGVPVSPIKMPPTPPRDHGSPYRPGNSALGLTAQAQVTPDHSRLLQPPSAFARSQHHPQSQQFLSTEGPFLQPQQQQMHPFLRPSSSLRTKEEDQGSSIFRSSPVLHSQHSEGLSRERDSYYTIQRSLAFDEESDDDENENVNYIYIFNSVSEA